MSEASDPARVEGQPGATEAALWTHAPRERRRSRQPTALLRHVAGSRVTPRHQTRQASEAPARAVGWPPHPRVKIRRTPAPETFGMGRRRAVRMVLASAALALLGAASTRSVATKCSLPRVVWELGLVDVEVIGGDAEGGLDSGTPHVSRWPAIAELSEQQSVGSESVRLSYSLKVEGEFLRLSESQVVQLDQTR